MQGIREEIKQYPSTFNITENLRVLSERILCQIKDKLLMELCSIVKEYSTTMEKVRVWNLLSYLYFVLGDHKTANKYNQDVLEENPNNVIALANKAWFSFKERKNLSVCKDSLERLKTLKSDSVAFLMAKAELAFTYSRFGLNLYYTAISTFRQVLEEVNTLIEQKHFDSYPVGVAGQTQDTLVSLKCVWMYGYALTSKRLLHITNVSDQNSVDAIIARHKFVFEMFESIIELEGDLADSECLQRFKARSLVEAGILAYGVNRNKSIFSRGMEDLLPRDSAISMPIYKYFEDALKLFPNYYFVLERSGRYFRYIDDIERSILHLERSIEIKRTSFACHHLALSYIRLLEYNPTKLRHCLDSISKGNEHNMTLIYQRTSQPSVKEKEVDAKANMAELTTDANISATYQTKMTSNNFAQEDKCCSDSASNTGEIDICKKYSSVRHGNAMSTLKNLVPACPNLATQSKLNPMAKIFKPQNEFRSEESCLTHTSDVFSIEQIPDSPTTPTFCVPVICNHQQYYLNSNHPNYKGIVCQQPTQQIIKGTQKAKRAQFQPARNLRKSFRNLTHNSRDRIRNCHFTKTYSKGLSLAFVVKCLRFPKLIDHEKNKDVIDIVISHLDDATRISSNTVALYDKAVFCRQIKQTGKALECLESLMKNEENQCSHVLLANAYEQAAFCICDILDGDEKIDAEREKQLINDKMIYLKSSIEVACSIIDRLPYLGHCWRSPQTLRHILLCNSDTDRTKETLKELWFLYTKIKNTEGVINVLQELKELTADDAEKREICEELVKKYLSVRNYEEAVIALSMLVPLDDMRACINPGLINKELHSQVYIESGLNAFHKKNFDKARLLIRKAFAKSTTSDADAEATDDSVDDSYDIFILSNLDDEEQGRNLMLLMNNLGLNTTFNSDSMRIKPGTPEIEGLTQVMSMSNTFVILVNWDLEDKKMRHLVDRMRIIVEERSETSVIFCVVNKEMQMPSTSCLSTYKRIILDTEHISESETGKDDNIEGLKTLLIELASLSESN